MMVKFKFWVPAKGWAAGGFENTHFAKTKEEAYACVDRWNKERNYSGDDVIRIIELTEITDKEFAEDYTG